MGIIDTLRKAFKMSPRVIKYDLEKFPELEGLAEARRGHDSYTEWMSGQYAHEMRRRFEYYEVNQVVQDPAVLQGKQYITPKLWRTAHRGSGWDDIRAMLPDATENTIVKPMVVNFTQVVVDNTGIVYSVPPKKREVLKGVVKLVELPLVGPEKPPEMEVGPDGIPKPKPVEPPPPEPPDQLTRLFATAFQQISYDEDNQRIEVEATQILNDVYESAEHDTKADQLCKWTRLFATAFQQISYDEDNQRIVKTNLQPQDVYVCPDKKRPWDLQHPNCFVAVRQDLDWETKSRPDSKIIWQCWWGKYWWYETEECVPFRDLDMLEEGVNENPYTDSITGRPVKPILVVHDKITGHVHDAGSDALVQQNQVFDRGMTGVTHTQEFQGFAIPVFSGTDVEEVEANPYSAAAPVILRDPQAKLSFAHPAAPIGESQGAVIKGMRTAARLHQIDPELVDPETKVQSGTSRAQGRIALAERRIVEFPKWVPFERESYWITGIMWNYHNPEGKQFLVIARFDNPNIPESEKVRILVQFGELAPVTDPMADAATNKMNLEMNVITTADIVASQRQIPVERAQEIVDENRARNKAERPPSLLEMKRAGGPPRLGQSGNRPTNPDRPADKTGGNTTSASGNNVIGKGE